MISALEHATSMNPSIDAEHRIQIELVLALCTAVETGQPAESVEEILRQLVSFSESHFMSEELLMRLASYDDYDDHVADHDRMLDALQEIASRYRVGESGLVVGKATSALEFLLQHIHTRDQRFQAWRRD